MERLKTIRKSIRVSASREEVWKVLLNEKHTSIWYGEFSKGSRAITDWLEGSKAIFTDHSDTGLIGRITKRKTPELLVIEYEGMIINGVEDYESEHAQAMQGAQEVYRLEEQQGTTVLSIECDMGAEYFAPMSEAWDRALRKIRQLVDENCGHKLNSGNNIFIHRNYRSLH